MISIKGFNVPSFIIIGEIIAILTLIYAEVLSGDTFQITQHQRC